MESIEIRYSHTTDSLFVRVSEEKMDSATEIEPGARLHFNAAGALVAIDIEHPATKFGLITHLYQRLLARKNFTGFNSRLLSLALNGLGVLNYASPDISGERWLLTQLCTLNLKPIVFDVGAHRGEFSKLVQEIVPQAVLYSFEPHPTCFQALKHAIDQTRAHLFQLGLSDARGSAALFDYCDADGSQEASLYREVFSELHQNHQPKSISIELDTIDTICEAQRVDQIDLLKIDVEGHELAVLRGARGLLERGAIKIIQFEFNEMNVISRAFVSDFMKLLPSFTLFRMLPDGLLPLSNTTALHRELFGYQNLCAVTHELAERFAAT